MKLAQIIVILMLSPCLLGLPVHAQNQVSLYQQAPEDWRGEVIPFPLEFAPEIDLTGVEELRFAPGMFDAESQTYFTYSFLWWLDGRPELPPKVLAKYLLTYFQGLYKAVSEQESKDVSDFSTLLLQDRTVKDKNRVHFRGQATWKDPFVTEDELILHIKAWQWYCPEQDRTAVFFALSPKSYKHSNWEIMEDQRAGSCQ